MKADKCSNISEQSKSQIWQIKTKTIQYLHIVWSHIYFHLYFLKEILNESKFLRDTDLKLFQNFKDSKRCCYIFHDLNSTLLFLLFSEMDPYSVM